MSEFEATGGCQCGAVRYRVHGEVYDPHVCYCRMCQKAAGNYFMAFAGVGRDDFTVERGEPGWFQSSEIARRGFCERCGTPLLYDPLESEYVAFTLGSLDDPSALPPVSAHRVGERLPFLHDLATLPAAETQPNDDANQNHQHPDESA